MTGNSRNGRLRAAGILVALCSSGLVAGCIGGPTYGTGTPAGEQLLKDLNNMASLRSDDDEAIAYSPRPELVEPGETAVLPPPQEDIASADNPQWPESPEQRRRRIRADADANGDNPNYEVAVRGSRKRGVDAETLRARSLRSNTDAGNLSAASRRESFNQRLAAANQGDPEQRRFLSEPPVEYRAPAATAPVNDVGEEEWKKERRAKQAARKDSSFSWRDVIPGF